MKILLRTFILLLIISCNSKEETVKQELVKEIVDNENILADQQKDHKPTELKSNMIIGNSTINSLRIRSIPDINYGEILGKVDLNEEVEIISRTQWNTYTDNITDRWLNIKTNNGINGWVFEGYLEYDTKIRIPESEDEFEIEKSFIVDKIEEIISNKTSEIVFPSEFDDKHQIIPTGYVEYNGILLWTHGSSLWAFNGNKIAPIFNINILSKDNKYMIGPIYKFNENKIFITTAYGKFGGFSIHPYFIFDLKTCMIEKDLDEKFNELIKNEDIYPYRNNCNLLYEGYKKVFNGNLYGVFRNNDKTSIFIFDKTEMKKLKSIPEEYYGYAMKLISESELIIYQPKNGWYDEDTVGPYITIKFDYINGIIVEKSLISEDIIWDYLKQFD
ncbi:SH3 domain-containing protein [Oceanispirochaeta crateris]|uniref:SH3 domain-containing protein n=1 Tax=Oceanispirochaeta crateris TaxID=2518645 RepID=A0A5C1QHS1_9SPIO|nr:SH3 domain-containing protein [Oceanispirochaeta crateris]QEN06828.1 SH3 domain-containing protein [Oceanispirochaeta crateris]